MREETLCLPMDKVQVLLGMKRKGFGEGKWNGFGGKPELGETIRQAAIRELKEESGLIVEDENLHTAGYLVFLFPDKMNLNRAVNVFIASRWKGMLTISDEMSPAWFKFDKIPFKSMWPDDAEWLPYVLKGCFVTGCYIFDESMEKVRGVLDTSGRNFMFPYVVLGGKL